MSFFTWIPDRVPVNIIINGILKLWLFVIILPLALYFPFLVSKAKTTQSWCSSRRRQEKHRVILEDPQNQTIKRLLRTKSAFNMRTHKEINEEIQGVEKNHQSVILLSLQSFKEILSAIISWERGFEVIVFWFSRGLERLRFSGVP